MEHLMIVFVIHDTQYRGQMPEVNFYLIPMAVNAQSQGVLRELRQTGGGYDRITGIPPIVRSLLEDPVWNAYKVNAPIQMEQGCIKEVVNIMYNNA